MRAVCVCGRAGLVYCAIVSIGLVCVYIWARRMCFAVASLVVAGLLTTV
jgi:hypothetical protein